jgi:hypothetical protein
MANALAFLKLSPQDHLSQLERAVCPKCLKKRKYFCYTCMVPMGDPALAPHLSLPLSVDMYELFSLCPYLYSLHYLQPLPPIPPASFLLYLMRNNSIHHPTELLSKSTAIHARIICPNDVKVYEFPDIPDYNLEETVLLFPSDVCIHPLSFQACFHTFPCLWFLPFSFSWLVC